MVLKGLGAIFVATGTALVLFMILAGIDARRSAGRGLPWKRRLVAAGLLFLGTLGFGCDRQESDEDPPAGDDPEQAVPQDPWERLESSRAQAEEIAAGRRGQYPFDQEGRKDLLDRLAAAGADLDALAASGRLTEPEASLLKQEFRDLARAVSAFRPIEMREATCYEPMDLFPARESIADIRARLPILKRLLESRELHPDVVRRVLVTIRHDLDVLGSPRDLHRFGQEIDQVARDRDEARALVDRIEERLAGEDR